MLAIMREGGREARSLGQDDPIKCPMRQGSCSRGPNAERERERTHPRQTLLRPVVRHNRALRNRNALLTTDTELRLIASAAIIGDKVMPNHGYSTPAASGTPTAL